MIPENYLDSLVVFSEIADISRSDAFADVTSISALVWTFLLFVGLFFFIRASGKDRTEQRRWYSDRSIDDIGVQLQRYLQKRAYQLTETDDAGIATFVGQAQPSGFLTGLLSVMAAVGLSCLAIVLNALLYPNWQGFPFVLLLA
ncbi:MAG: cofactor assembly of complex C subunit B, partial [Cyanobacteria bacterium J06648_11]